MAIDLPAFRSQPLELLESKPLAIDAWHQLLTKVTRQNDQLSVKSITIILEGLNALEELRAHHQKQHHSPLAITSTCKMLFTRLARSYNNPILLKDVGLVYLRDFALPEIALKHLERALYLGASKKDVQPLCDAAQAAIQMQSVQRSSQEAGDPGILKSEHAKPIAANIIRKTGKLIMSGSLKQEGTTEPAVNEAQESESERVLPATTAECLEQAQLAIAEGKLKWAKTLLLKADEKPASILEMWQAWTDLGFAAYHARLYALVETCFVEALKYESDSLASHFNAGLGYYLNDKCEQALVEYEKARKIDPQDAKNWCNLGVLHFQMDKYELAEEAFRQAIRNRAAYARAWDNLGASLGAQNKLDEAIEACRQALALRPEYPEANFKIGVIYFNQGDFPRAAAEFERAAALPSLTIYCESFVALIHDQLGNHNQIEEPGLEEATVG